MNRKSQIVGILLTTLLGPLGLLYCNLAAGVIMTIIAILIGAPTGLIGSVLLWPVCIIMGIYLVAKHNERQEYLEMLMTAGVRKIA